uniref:Uncharacterized protein n=1 Tax=Arundo donax TaxID=35708 RepID=A0A0A9HDJ1_ARUDO
MGHLKTPPQQQLAVHY